jgi:phage shock protein PspC (stress-responsive transcriptional regulator)
MLKKLFTKGVLKDAGNILQALKDNKGRFSSKRTVAGVIAGTGAAVVTGLDISTITVAQALLVLGSFAIAGLILILSPVVEKQTQDEYPTETE